MKHTVIKTYGHEQGLSCTFRQPRAPSTHCSRLHGYSIAVELAFSCEELDERHWVLSFGDLKPVKAELAQLFDHRTLVHEMDPEIFVFRELHERGVLNLVVCSSGVGCEKFSECVAAYVVQYLDSVPEYKKRGVKLEYVKLSEHGGNSVKLELPPATSHEYMEILNAPLPYTVHKPMPYPRREGEDATP